MLAWFLARRDPATRFPHREWPLGSASRLRRLEALRAAPLRERTRVRRTRRSPAPDETAAPRPPRCLSSDVGALRAPGRLFVTACGPRELITPDPTRQRARGTASW